MKTITLLRLLRFWPPYLGAGVRVTHINSDLTSIEVQMKLHFWNKNYVGTQFGGSLYTMVDPFFMMMLLHNLGRDYIVWDKSAAIRFRKPGTGIVSARFELSREQIEEIRSLADQEPKVEPQFQVHILDMSGQVIAEVDKTLYVRRKDK